MAAAGDGTISRRTVLLGLAALSATGAGAAFALRERTPGAVPVTPPTSAASTTTQTPAPSPTAVSTSATATATSSPSPTSSPTQRPVTWFEPARADVYRDIKRPAGRFVQALAGAAIGLSVDDAVEQALAASRGGDPRSSDATTARATRSVAEQLHPTNDVHTATVINAQLSGLPPADGRPIAGVMVVCRQEFADGRVVTRTVDVRLTKQGGEWHVNGLPSAGGTPVRRPRTLSRAAVAVLDNPRIELPDSARWDIHAGVVEDRLLTLMASMAAQFPYAVTCLRNGHPEHVFATNRTSNHTVGRGVDIWRVGNDIVAAQRNDKRSAAYKMTSKLYAEGVVMELGSPWDFDAGVDLSFTNDVHLDHLHVAFERR